MNNEFSVISDKICLKVKFERIKRNLSQEQLAFKANVNKNTIWKIETGKVSPTIETLEKIANAFGMNFLDLIDVSKIDL
ncbi:MAG: helix-turn-helix transcriptional regulator [Cyanobacteria bacterium SIG27]|nr:helix-turn-helix transcriptional regulator [Cyanobacteria bacterium SIG27]